MEEIQKRVAQVTDTDKRTGSSAPTAKPEPPSSTLPRNGRQEKWKTLQSHLDRALHHWNEISEQMEGELSHEEKQLREVKALLQQLKTKLDQF